MYRPITARPSRAVNAAMENPSSPHNAESATVSHTAFTGVWVFEFILFQNLDPGKALSLEKAKMERLESTVCAAPVKNWVIMTKDHIASIPLGPRTSKIKDAALSGNGLVTSPFKSVEQNENTINSNHPNEAVEKTAVIIPTGAARLGFFDSSDI